MKAPLVAFLVCTWPLLALYIAAQWFELRTMRAERKSAAKERDDAVKLSRYLEGEMATAKRRCAHLEEHNAQLIYNALSQNVRLIKVNKN